MILTATPISFDGTTTAAEMAERIADVINALQGQVPPPLYDFLAGEQSALERLATANTPLDKGGRDSLEWIVDFLGQATSKPMIRCRVIRTTTISPG